MQPDGGGLPPLSFEFDELDEDTFRQLDQSTSHLGSSTGLSAFERMRDAARAHAALERRPYMADTTPGPRKIKRERGEASGTEDDAEERKPATAVYSDAYAEHPDAYETTGFNEGAKFWANKRKKLKVQQEAQRELDRDREDVLDPIFKGMRIYINGLTEETGFSLRQMTEIIVRRGGEHIPYMDKMALVTHIVAVDLTLKKRDEFLKRKYKLATPQWLVDCAEANRVLDWHPYSLLAVNATETRPTIGFDDERGVMGTQTAQKSLFSVGIATRTNKLPSPKTLVPPVPAQRPNAKSPAPKALSETIETLSDRGDRLGKAAAALVESSTASSSISSPTKAAFFEPRSRPTSPIKLPNPVPPVLDPLDATTDHAGPISDAYRAYLPTKARSTKLTALLQDPDWLAKHTSRSKDFLDGYFAQSRLHHLSMWKEELKEWASQMQEAKIPRSTKLTGTPSDNRTIFHVDFDQFFVAVGLLTRPELRGKCIAVCHAKGSDGDGMDSTSEIASCSYEARKFGVVGGMSLGRARENCPDIVTIPFEFEKYKDISNKFYQILLRHARYLQAVSVDEVLMEVTLPPPSPSGSVDPALDLAHLIRDEIRAATGCEASIGISHNILLSRLATKRAKPASAFHLLPPDVPAFLAEMKVRDLHGVGSSTAHKMTDELHCQTVGELSRVNRAHMKSVLGEQLGLRYEAFAKGIDDKDLEWDKPRQSVSAEVNYGIRFNADDDVEVERFIRQLSTEHIADRLRKGNYKARTLLLKVMRRSKDAALETPKFLGHGSVDCINAQSPISGSGQRATDDGRIIGDVALKLLLSMQIPHNELRGIGMTLSKLEKNGVSVSVARLPGQRKLGFTAVKETEARTLESFEPETEPELAQPPPAQEKALPSAPPRGPPHTRRQSALKKATSILVLSSDDDDEVAPLPLRRNASRASSVAVSTSTKSASRTPSVPPPAADKKDKPAKPAALFNRAKKNAARAFSEPDEEELAHLGIDSSFYAALPRDDQRATVTQLRRQIPPAPPKVKKETPKVKKETPPTTVQTRITSQVSKPSVTADDAKAKKGKAPVVQPPPPPSPSVVSDERLKELKLDPTVFRCLPRDVQEEQLAMQLSRVVAGPKPKARDTARRVVEENVTIALPWSFHKKTDLEDLRDQLEQWVRGCLEEGPDDGDVQTFTRFLCRCIEGKPVDRLPYGGQDFEKAIALVKWWHFLLEEEYGAPVEVFSFESVSETPSPAARWWSAFDVAKEAVVEKVKEVRGGAGLRL